jgi:hypothetical protein
VLKKLQPSSEFGCFFVLRWDFIPRLAVNLLTVREKEAVLP